MRSGTCTSRARMARRIEAAANSRNVPMRAPPSTKSFPAPKTRVLRAMNTGSYYKCGNEKEEENSASALLENSAEKGLEAVAIGSRAEVAAIVDDRLRQRGVRTARIK